jgi:hypothetical protein
MAPGLQPAPACISKLAAGCRDNWRFRRFRFGPEPAGNGYVTPRIQLDLWLLGFHGYPWKKGVLIRADFSSFPCQHATVPASIPGYPDTRGKRDPWKPHG